MKITQSRHSSENENEKIILSQNICSSIVAWIWRWHDKFWVNNFYFYVIPDEISSRMIYQFENTSNTFCNNLCRKFEKTIIIIMGKV